MFRMIGYFEITHEGDVVHVRSAPEFNLEAAQQYARDMMVVIERMPPRFGTLVEFPSPPIIGPEVEAAMRESAKQRAARGMVAAAFVTENLEGIRVASAQWDRIYEPSGIAIRFFHEVGPARDWLQAFLRGDA
jgi:hypothetical protein